MRAWLAVPAAFTLVACNEPLVACQTSAPLFTVDVYDGTTGIAAAYEARLVISHGMEADTVLSDIAAVDSLVDARIMGTSERFKDEPGVYDLKVVRQGYAPWAQVGIAVPRAAGGCNIPATVPVTVALQRE